MSVLQNANLYILFLNGLPHDSLFCIDFVRLGVSTILIYMVIQYLNFKQTG